MCFENNNPVSGSYSGDLNNSSGDHGNRGGSSGRSGDGDAGGESGDGDANGFLSRLWPGWRRRVLADPDFPFKVLMEETVGLGLAASGMIAARGKSILRELDFALCDIAVGATLNFILVYLLSPAVARSGPSAVGAAGLMRLFNKLPSNVFVKGNYSIAQRTAGFFYKGAVFALCGFLGSVVGTTLSQALVAIRHVHTGSADGFEKSNRLPNVGANSMAWAGFMLFSSNPRYQVVAGVERVLFAHAPDAVAKIGCGTARTLNNIIGGAIWVWWARFVGLQKKEE